MKSIPPWFLQISGVLLFVLLEHGHHLVHLVQIQIEMLSWKLNCAKCFYIILVSIKHCQITKSKHSASLIASDSTEPHHKRTPLVPSVDGEGRAE